MARITHKYNYDFLAPSFLKFYKEKQEKLQKTQSKFIRDSVVYISEMKVGENPGYDAFLQELGLTREQFEIDYIEPYKRLDYQKALTVSHLQNLLLASKGYKFQVASTELDAALGWTLVNIIDLGLFEIGNLAHLSGLYYHPAQHSPCHQCLYCGRVDGDELGRFSKHHDKWFCCLESCLDIDGKCGEHGNCCTTKWRTIKSSFIRRLNRNYASKEKTIRVFVDFCEERYHLNARNPFIRPWISHRLEGCKGTAMLKQCAQFSLNDDEIFK